MIDPLRKHQSGVERSHFEKETSEESKLKDLFRPPSIEDLPAHSIQKQANQTNFKEDVKDLINHEGRHLDPLIYLMSSKHLKEKAKVIINLFNKF